VTRYELDGSGIESGEGEIFCCSPEWHWGLLSLLYNATLFFSEVKRAGRDLNHPPPSNVEVKEKLELYFYPLWAFIFSSIVNLTAFFTLICNSKYFFNEGTQRSLFDEEQLCKIYKEYNET